MADYGESEREEGDQPVYTQEDFAEQFPTDFSQEQKGKMWLAKRKQAAKGEEEKWEESEEEKLKGMEQREEWSTNRRLLSTIRSMHPDAGLPEPRPRLVNLEFEENCPMAWDVLGIERSASNPVFLECVHAAVKAYSKIGSKPSALTVAGIMKTDELVSTQCEPLLNPPEEKVDRSELKKAWSRAVQDYNACVRETLYPELDEIYESLGKLASDDKLKESTGPVQSDLEYISGRGFVSKHAVAWTRKYFETDDYDEFMKDPDKAFEELYTKHGEFVDRGYSRLGQHVKRR